MNNIRNVLRLPNSSAYYWGGQSTGPNPYTPQCAHSHRQHSPTQATTQEFLMFIRHPEPQLKRCYSKPQLKEYHVLNPYPEPQLQGYVPSHNSRDTLRYPRSLVDHSHQRKQNTFASRYRLA